MAQNQTCPPPKCRALPKLWVLSDARNDARLEAGLQALPRGSGFIFRHYHLPAADRRTRFAQLAAHARKYGHMVILSDTPRTARRWAADGVYGPASAMTGGGDCLKFMTAHTAREIIAADRAGAHAILLSPIFPTRSHPDARPLGPVRFRMLARNTNTPIIALGGMRQETAKRLGWSHWAAVDGLVSTQDS